MPNNKKNLKSTPSIEETNARLAEEFAQQNAQGQDLPPKEGESKAPAESMRASSVPADKAEGIAPDLSGPHRLQWLFASDTEMVKLVETTRTLCQVHFASSPPTYFNPIPKEKWSPSSLSIPGPLRSLTLGQINDPYANRQECYSLITATRLIRTRRIFSRKLPATLKKEKKTHPYS